MMDKKPEDFKEEFEEAKRKTMEQHRNQRIAMKKDIMEHTQTLHQRLRKYMLGDEINYVIHNFIMARHSFVHCKDHLELVRTYYNVIYFIIKDFQDTQNKAKELLVELSKYANERQMRELTKIVELESPFKLAEDALKKIQQGAKRRSKKGIQSYTSADAQELGIKI